MKATPNIKMILLYVVWAIVVLAIMVDHGILLTPSIVCVAPLAVATVAGLRGKSIFLWGVVTYCVGLAAMMLAGAAYVLTIQQQDGLAVVSLGAFLAVSMVALYYLVKKT